MRQRSTLLFLSVGLLGLALAVELGSGLLIEEGSKADVPTPGMGIPYLALLDGLLFFAILVKALSGVLPPRLLGASQGCATFLVALCALIGGIVMIVVALVLLALMVGLFLAVPFGTAVYLAIYGSFDRNGAAVALSLCMFLKLASAGCMLLSHPDELKTKATLFFFGSSLLANIVVSWLHGFLPRILASITDTVAAIVVAILGVIWAVLLLIGSISPIVKTLRRPPLTES